MVSLRIQKGQRHCKTTTTATEFVIHKKNQREQGSEAGTKLKFRLPG